MKYYVTGGKWKGDYCSLLQPHFAMFTMGTQWQWKQLLTTCVQYCNSLEVGKLYLFQIVWSVPGYLIFIFYSLHPIFSHKFDAIFFF